MGGRKGKREGKKRREEGRREEEEGRRTKEGVKDGGEKGTQRRRAGEEEVCSERGERREQSRYCDLVAMELYLEAANGEEDVLLGQLEACALQGLEVCLIVILSEAGDLPCA